MTSLTFWQVKKKVEEFLPRETLEWEAEEELWDEVRHPPETMLTGHALSQSAV